MFVIFARAGSRFLSFLTKVDFKPAESAEALAKLDSDNSVAPDAAVSALSRA